MADNVTLTLRNLVLMNLPPASSSGGADDPGGGGLLLGPLAPLANFTALVWLLAADR